MERPPHLPDHPEIKIADSMESMLSQPFDESSVIVHPRPLEDDFSAFAQWLYHSIENQKIDVLTIGHFKALLVGHHLSELFQRNAEFILHDMEVFNATGAVSDLRVTVGAPLYFAFHMDRPKPTKRQQERGKILTFYAGQTTEGLLSHQVADPEIPNGFKIFEPKSDEKPFGFNLGDSWRHAEKGSTTKALPFIHRSKWATYRLGIVAD